MSVPFDSCAVKIAVRERPTRETPENARSIIVYPTTSQNILIVDERPFVFDYVFNPEITQQKLFYDLIKPLVDKVLQGFSCSALAYGQTGTGKSYTMGLDSSQSFEGENVGVIPRCIREVFNSDDNNENIQTLQNREIHISFVEIYNERVYDLLSANPAEPIFARGGCSKFTGGTRKQITNLQECCCILNQGNKNRHVRPTIMNSQSSRSHAIFTIHVETMNSEKTVSSCLNLVDLAGSEGVRRTGHQGVAMSEGVHINKGLLSIGKVLQALTQGQKVIPYRDSVLSSVLQDSFNPNSYLTLVACISPLRVDVSETLSTLRFAQDAKQLRHTPHMNTILSEIKKNKVKTPNPNKPVKHVATPYLNITNVTKSGTKAVGYHSHTFCTPSKMKKVDSNKFNRTEMGLTPKEKEKVSVQRQSVRKYPLATVSNQLGFNRDSLFNKNNDTIESRSSLFSLNISTSTAVDAPSNNQALSYSPLIRKIMIECQQAMENKLEQIMESKMEKINEALKSGQQTRVLIDSNMYGSDITHFTNTPGIFERPASAMPDILGQEQGHTVKETCEQNSVEVTRPSAKDHVDLSCPTISPKKQSAKCQLFATSSPVFKAPAVPELRSEISQTESFLNLDLSSTNFFTHGMEQTVKNTIGRRLKRKPNDDSIIIDGIEQTVQNNVGRRSQRLSTRKLNESIVVDGMDHTVQNNVVRRSLRLSTRKLNESILSESSFSKTKGQSRCLTSIKEINDRRRRSVRLASHKDNFETSMNEIEKPKNKRGIKKQQVLDNSVISTYFDTTNWESKSNKNLNISNHKKAVLDLLNKGSMKSLQLLPQIGQKTAYQLITHRTLNGKFKSLAQVEKLPCWRGKAYTRFAEANMLL